MTRRHTLGSACVQIVDCEHKTAPTDENGDYFAVGTPAMRGNMINYQEARRITKGTFASWTRRLTPRVGDLLFAREAPVGPIVQIPAIENVAPGQRTVLLRPDPDIVDSNYLYYLLSSPQQQGLLTAKGGGSTVAHLNVADVRSFELPDLPQVDEQRAIANVLGALDDKIAANSEMAAKLVMLATVTFEQAIEERSSEHSIADLTKMISRGITPTYTESNDAVTVLNQKCIRDQEVVLGPARKTARVRVTQKKVLLTNDVLINSTGQGTLGRIARWTYDGEATVDSHISIVRFDERIVDPICGGYSALRMQPLIEQMGEGSTGQTELSRVELAKVRVRLPNRDIQRELGRRLGVLSKLQDAQRDQSEVLAAMRDALLPQLMSGKIQVRDAEKTVEEVL